VFPVKLVVLMKSEITTGDAAAANEHAFSAAFRV
jgi:hypothetical protein